jgi:hypothetical protein
MTFLLVVQYTSGRWHRKEFKFSLQDNVESFWWKIQRSKRISRSTLDTAYVADVKGYGSKEQ